MTDASKLTLSTEELQLVTDKGWILTKRTVIDKVNKLLGAHAAFAQEYMQQTALPQELMHTSPKISNGENYLQLPWVMLDYPRAFEKENIFAIRTMFWWGNFFSVTLHVSGRYKKHFETKLAEGICLPEAAQFYICTNEDEWQHHFNKDNYTAVAGLPAKEAALVFANAAFIKIACKYPLQQWDEIPLLLQQSFKTLLKMLAD